MLPDTPALLAAQARSLDLARAWRAGDAYRATLARFAPLDPGDVDAVADAAAALLADAGWAGALLAPLAAALRTDPWSQPPFRVHRDGLRIGAVLVESPAVSITASVLSADALAAAPAPRTVVASGRMSVVRYARTGAARLRRWHAGPAPAAFVAATAPPATPLPPERLVDGMVIRHDGRTEGHLIDGARADMATLTVALRGGTAPLMREYRVADGALVRAAATDDAGSRTAMLLTLLRLTGRADAAEAFDAASRTPAFELRWTAMREWLALDLAAALPRLREMADDPHPDVRRAARATLPIAEGAMPCPA